MLCLKLNIVYGTFVVIFCRYKNELTSGKLKCNSMKSTLLLQRLIFDKNSKERSQAHSLLSIYKKLFLMAKVLGH